MLAVSVSQQKVNIMMGSIEINLPDDLYQKLIAEAQKLGLSIAEFIEEELDRIYG